MVNRLEEEPLELAEDSQKDKYLTFALGNEEYGIAIRYVTEIIGLQAITEIPEIPAYVKGIINLRGKIIPVIDMRLRFKKEAREYTNRTCTIVIHVGAVAVGLIVDAVSEVLPITADEIAPPPALGDGSQHRFLRGIGKVGNEVKLLLDCDRLLDGAELENLSSIA
ncbi:purine-binding chemotaxis protein CheW [Hydrogenispora ethanolica]|jgi:purine-binding chemotaxis protein CheW|uniref:Chemotaxis protein CheW n=1 Tax=Hydrogenispora ethanolica TaxID=1082276 RepID=A0A4R1QV82_HYDET|nr:chemotaxis protein CheW [Hydrogenispora ethanolica]TCL57869.1 purine-binding chemotaxis protein CheW [Hydrogenispora ethanolica]